ncbi:uncharacterized protein [Malus domestica]|uniref:uncharacterized protein n=1 Tax=Malus domestica TaxID=3750 RepID=UPI00397499EB
MAPLVPISTCGSCEEAQRFKLFQQVTGSSPARSTTFGILFFSAFFDALVSQVRSQDIRIPLEQKLIKRMNFGVILIGGYSGVFQDDCIKIPDFLPSRLTVAMKRRPSAQLFQIDISGCFGYFGGQDGIF